MSRRLYIIDNGCGWSDRTIYFVETEYSPEVVGVVIDAIVSLGHSEKPSLMGVVSVIEWRVGALPIEEFIIQCGWDLFDAVRDRAPVVEAWPPELVETVAKAFGIARGEPQPKEPCKACAKAGGICNDCMPF